MADMVFVKNNTASLHGVPMITPSQAAGAPATMANLMVRPGVNEIPADKWELARIHCREHLEDERFEVLHEMSRSPEAPLADLSARKAIAVVKQTVTTPLLQKWAAAEKRADVVGAIEAQLARLEIKPGDSKTGIAVKK